MSEEPPSPTPFPARVDIRSFSLTGLFLLATLYTLYVARAFVMPLIVALLLAILFRGAVRWLARAHIPQGVSAALILAGLLAATGIGLYSLSGPAASWVAQAPTVMRRVEGQLRHLLRPLHKVSLLVVAVLLYFLLASGDLFLAKLVKLLPRFTDKKRAVQIARDAESQISAYLTTITLMNAAFGLAVGLASFALGLPNPVLWGVLAGVTNYVPYMGALVMAMVLGVVALLQFEGVGRAALVMGVFFALNFLEGYLVTPRLLGRRLSLNPVVVTGVLFWAGCGASSAPCWPCPCWPRSRSSATTSKSWRRWESSSAIDLLAVCTF